MNTITRSIFATILFGVAHTAFALSLTNAGFVPSNYIWYSKDPFYTGDSIRIYTVVFNGSDYDLTGAVEFTDNGASLGKAPFSLAHGGRAQDVWIDWKAKAGKHTVAAHLVDLIADGPDGKQAVTLPDTQTGTSERTVVEDPKIQAAKTQAVVDQVTNTGNQIANTIEGAGQAVVDGTPAPVKEAASGVFGALEAFRLGQASYFESLKEKQAAQIAGINAEEKQVLATSTQKTIGNATNAMVRTAEKPFAYVLLFIDSALHLLFQWSVVFYGVLAYALYRLVRFGIRKIRRED